MAKYDIILVANSPGELSALVKPVAESISDNIKEARIILVLTPCQYTSEKELEYIKTIRGISTAISAQGYKNWIILNHRPKIKFSGKGLVLYLGGDLAHAILVAKKVGYPAWAYVQDRIAWTNFYKRFFVPDAGTLTKFAKNKKLRAKLKVVGNLMADSVSDLPKWSPKKNMITLLPGSRAWQIKHMTPIYERIVRHIKIEMPNAVFQVVSSPFEKAMEIKGARTVRFEDVPNSELIITIPGTNTARLAALGIPMIVIFPLDNPDVIPLEGLAHYIGKIPYLGSRFRKTLADTLNRKIKFFALPNIKADQEIVPEIRGIIEPTAVALKAVALLKDEKKRAEMSKDLQRALGEPGAAHRITEEINEALHTAA
jgi:lipid-A-disaccharide synthase